MSSFKSQLVAKLGWRWQEGATDDNRLVFEQYFNEGNGENQAEAVWHLSGQELGDGEDLTLDLTALTRTVLGDTLTTTFLTIKAIFIVNRSEEWGAELLVGGAAAYEWYYPFGGSGHIVSVPPDSPLLLCNRIWGWAVDDSNKNLLLEAAGGDVEFDIAIIGTLTTSASGSSGD